jgi:hypothetical protein
VLVGGLLASHYSRTPAYGHLACSEPACPALLYLQGARVPVLVGGLLASHYADTLACGISHVAVVATQRGKANGGASGGLGSSSSSSSSTAVTRLLTWGQNSRGQLGIGTAREDHLLPQVGGWMV